MSIQAPKLDNRTFEQLLDEAMTRIPQFTPEWTNFNDADPGMALVQLHAWLTETILYRVNQLPDLNYIKFLNLLNIRPTPATPARAELTFTLKTLREPSDALLVLIPKGTRAAVDDPDLTEELVFETDRTLRAVNAALATLIVPVSDADDAGGNSLLLATAYDDDLRAASIPNPVYAFGSLPDIAPVPYFLIGLLLRPHRRPDPNLYTLDRFPAGELDLSILVPQVFELDADQVEITGPQSLDCLFPWQVTEQGERIVWEAYIGTQHGIDFTQDNRWERLDVTDETAGLTRSGHVFLNVPANLPAVGFDDLDADAIWGELGLRKPPTNKAELIAALNADFDPADLDVGKWADLGIEDPVLDNDVALIAQIDAADLNFAALATDDWVDAGFNAPPVPHPLVWFRARLVQPAEEPQQITQVLLNTVGATAAVTVTDEIVGPSDGRPNQTFRLRRTPVVVDMASRKPDLAVEVRTFGTAEPWEIVEDFFGAKPDSKSIAFDPATGELRFGDGVFGRIPVAGSEVIARRYRFGGGAVGNVGQGTITALRGGLFDVDSVTNHRPAFDGSNAETLDAVKLRAPHDLRTRDRAVTSDDFAELALRTPGVAIHSAFALPLTRVDRTTRPHGFVEQAGAVTVVILPITNDDTPEPSEDQLRVVCAHLNQRRLITTELYVIGPRYLKLQRLRAEITVSRQSDLKALTDTGVQRLLDYFHPLRGGETGAGWPFGQDIFFGNVYRQLLNIPGVMSVLCLEIVPNGGTPPDAECADVIPVPDGTLIHLPRTAIDLEVRYDPLG